MYPGDYRHAPLHLAFDVDSGDYTQVLLNDIEHFLTQLLATHVISVYMDCSFFICFRILSFFEFLYTQDFNPWSNE